MSREFIARKGVTALGQISGTSDGFIDGDLRVGDPATPSTISTDASGNLTISAVGEVQIGSSSPEASILTTDGNLVLSSTNSVVINDLLTVTGSVSTTGVTIVNDLTSNNVKINNTLVIGVCSYAAPTYYNVAAGESVFATATASHAEGFNTIASGYASHAEGGYTVATEDVTHTEGYGTSATANGAHAEGLYTYAGGPQSHAEGLRTYIDAGASTAHAEGFRTYIDADASTAHTEGYYTSAYKAGGHAEGYGTAVSGLYSHADGLNSKAFHDVSFIWSSNGASTTQANQFKVSGNSVILGNDVTIDGGITFTGVSVTNSATAANIYLTLNVNGSALGLPLYNI